MHDRWRTLATQLYLAVCERRMETDEYLTRLERLREWNKDRLIDHVRAWRLLASVGRRGEAIERAQAFSDLPTTGLETLQLAQAFFALGLRDSAAKLLDHFSTEFSFLDALWALYANLLIESQQWSRLHQLALKIGYARYARTLLASAERQNEKSPAYWELIAAVAFSLKDADLHLRAATESAALNPGSWTARNNLAAALVTNRRDPEEAIKTTGLLVTEFADVPAVRLNHALALIQNRRYDEADRLLAGLQPKELTVSERAVYQLACFETLVRQRRFELARSFRNEIDPQQLFPCQREHLQLLASELSEPE